jgi:hypothetical protein
MTFTNELAQKVIECINNTLLLTKFKFFYEAIFYTKFVVQIIQL